MVTSKVEHDTKRYGSYTFGVECGRRDQMLELGWSYTMSGLAEQTLFASTKYHFRDSTNILEHGIRRNVSNINQTGSSMSLSTSVGVTMNIEFTRYNQYFRVPILLSNEFNYLRYYLVL